MAGIGPIEIMIVLAIAAVVIAVCHGIAATIQDGEMMHNLRIEVHELHRLYIARLRGEDPASMQDYANSDVEPVVGSIEPEAQTKPAAREAA